MFIFFLISFISYMLFICYKLAILPLIFYSEVNLFCPLCMCWMIAGLETLLHNDPHKKGGISQIGLIQARKDG